jgi:transcriptional regulator with XRE-family HTH domain
MKFMNELGEFLRARRAGLNPADFSVPDAGRRRVPGLRREELAQLAGISADYYTRLEQGRATNASPSILDALARVLGLNQDERAHLTRLANPARGPVPQAKVRPELRWLLDSLETVPAFVLGSRMDVLAWNSLAGALLPDALAHGNLLRFMFLDPLARTLFEPWEVCAQENVAYLRLDAGHHPDDPALAALVGELSIKSPEFRRWWAAHPVRRKEPGHKTLHHPMLGELRVATETLALPDGGVLVTYTAEPGSPSADALRLLRTLSASAMTDGDATAAHERNNSTK